MSIRYGPQRYVARPELIKIAIEANGLTQKFFARRLEMSRPQISRIINGKKTVAEPDARVIATHLGCDFRVLFELPRENKSVPRATKGGRR